MKVWECKNNHSKLSLGGKYNNCVLIITGCYLSELFILSSLIEKIEDLVRDWSAKIVTHHLGISYYVDFLGCLGNNGFQLKRRFGTHGHWKNLSSKIYILLTANSTFTLLFRQLASWHLLYPVELAPSSSLSMGIL